MNKTQLIDVVADAADLSKAKATAVIEAITNAIIAALAKKEEVELPKIGRLSTKDRAARVGRDPRTGGALQIPAAVVANFKASKALKDALNGVIAKKAKA